MKERKSLRRVSTKRLFEIVQTGAANDFWSRAYDILSVLLVLVNLTVTVMYTFNSMEARFGPQLLLIEKLTVHFFALDYALRFVSSSYLYPAQTPGKALLKYCLSFAGVVDLLSFLPFYLPGFFPAGAVAFKMFRVVRIFRLFRINAYYDSLNVITEVLKSRRQQLLSSVFIISILMLASSMCMYSIENEAQPEVFSNAFSGIWWAVSTLLTVGYGDIYPITPLGKAFSIVITFLGVGMVAIPTGIISAGFVDQYSRFKRISEFATEEEVHFIKVRLHKDDKWVNTEVKDLGLPRGTIIAAVRRGHEVLVPKGDMLLKRGDTIILGAESLKEDKHIDLKELVLKKHHPWTGQLIRELDMSRQTLIVMVRRSGTMLVPRGDMRLCEGDELILYSQTSIPNADIIRI